MQTRLLCRVVLLLGVLSFSRSSRAEEIPVETFFRNPDYGEAQLSPTGEYLAALAPDGHRVGLAIVDLKARKASWAVRGRDADIYWFHWFNNDRLLFKVADEKQGYDLGGLFAVNRDGAKYRQLVRTYNFRTQLLDLLGGESDEILVTTSAISAFDPRTGLRFPHVARMNVFTGHMQREVTNPGHVVSWFTDHHGLVRLGVSMDLGQGQKPGTIKMLYRPDRRSPWTTLFEYKSGKPAIYPHSFADDDRTLYVVHYGRENTMGLYTFDTEKKSLGELLFRHKEVDIGGIFVEPRSGKLLGLAYESDRPELFWTDPHYARLQAAVDQALPGGMNLLVDSASRDESKLLFLATSDRNPGTYYLFDTASNKLEELFPTCPRIKPDQMASMTPIQYQARDGLTIHGYLTLPRGSDGRNLPLIVNPHGGPQARDHWGYNPEVQFLASRGYAVLQMNFRGSTGYGRAFQKAGYKQWGLKMQDDITDGVHWAIEKGIADPKRIAIYGASYGGYAALMGLITTPELYRCGISYAGVTDLGDVVKRGEQRFRLPDVRLLFEETIGDLKADKERLRETSPLANTDKINAPVFLAYGKLDPRVPFGEGRDLARELKRKGKQFVLMVKDDEGHGFQKEENKIEFYRKVDEFLKENLK